MSAIGMDCGTYNLVCSRRDKDNNFVYKREVNAFLEMPLENRFVFNMMKNAGVPLIERPEQNIAYALGESALNIAYTMNQLELKRPMTDGCLNPKEKNAQQILSIMLHSLVGEIEGSNQILCFSVPANAINKETDADYHSKILEAIFRAYKSKTGLKLEPRPINEGLAVVYAELGKKGYTGVGVSCGSGQVNVCYSIFGAPAFQFSIVNSGDWIDKQAAKAVGESPTFINKEKEKIDFTVEPNNMIHRAIRTQYEIMIEKTVAEIKKGIESVGNKAKTEHPVDVVLAGGTSLPNGFDKLFESTIRKANLSIDIGAVVRPEDPLFSVAKGCLVAAEASG